MVTNTLLFIAITLALYSLVKNIKSHYFPAPAFYILIGVIIGPLALNWLTPSDSLAWIAESTVVFMLFSAGLEIRWHNFFKAIKPGLLVGLMGIAISFTLGTIVVISLTQKLDEALYVGAALSATSIGLSIPLLTRFNLLNSNAGQILLAAAVVDDVAALYLLSVLHASFTSDNSMISIILSLLAGMLSLGLAVLIVSLFNSYLIKKIPERHKALRRILTASIVGASAFGTHHFGLSAAVGAFAAGATMSFSVCCVRSPDEAFFDKISGFLAPFFFFNIGLQITQLDMHSPHMIQLGTLVLIAAIAGKLLSPWILINSTTANERNIIGWALVPRAEVAIVIASVGMQQGHLGHHSMISIVFMTMCTAILAPVVMPLIVQKSG